MKCNFSKQLMIEISKDGQTLFYKHCCVLFDELISARPTQELLDAKDTYAYLNKIFKKNPKNHNFNPKNNDCNGETNCDFRNEDFNFLTVSTQACNLKCKMCVVDKACNKFERDASTKAYNDILNKIQNLHLHHCQISSSGEPFLQKESTINWITSIKEGTIGAVGFVTNATLLSPQDIDLMCSATKEKRIWLAAVVSCDGITAETYRKVRNINSFDKVLENILAFKRNDRLHCVNFVITPDNIHELKDVPNFWLSKGITPRIIYPICHPEWDWMRSDPRVKYIQENYNQYYVNN